MLVVWLNRVLPLSSRGSFLQEVRHSPGWGWELVEVWRILRGTFQRSWLLRRDLRMAVWTGWGGRVQSGSKVLEVEGTVCRVREEGVHMAEHESNGDGVRSEAKETLTGRQALESQVWRYWAHSPGKGVGGSGRIRFTFGRLLWLCHQEKGLDRISSGSNKNRLQPSFGRWWDLHYLGQASHLGSWSSWGSGTI